MVARRRSALRLVPALNEAVFLQKRADAEADIPTDAEMPAAAALAVAGIALEAARLIAALIS